MQRPFLLWYILTILRISGHTHASFPYIEMPLDYILPEVSFGKNILPKQKYARKCPRKKNYIVPEKKGIHPVFKVLKNAARATIESNPNLRGSSLPPVSIVLASNSQVREMVLMVLFSDLGRYNSIFFPGLHYPHFWPRRWNPSRPSIRLFLWKRTFHHLLPSSPRWRRCCSTPTPPQRRARTRSSRTPASLDPWWRQSIGIVDEILNP